MLFDDNHYQLLIITIKKNARWNVEPIIIIIYNNTLLSKALWKK